MDIDITIKTGRLGKDAELKTRDNGTKYLSFSLANEKKKINGEKRTKWYNCVQNVYGDGGAKLADCLKKGVQVLVTGTTEEKNGDNGIIYYFNVQTLNFLGGNGGTKKENKNKMPDENDDIF